MDWRSLVGWERRWDERNKGLVDEEAWGRRAAAEERRADWWVILQRWSQHEKVSEDRKKRSLRRTLLSELWLIFHLLGFLWLAHLSMKPQTLSVPG